MHAASGLLRRSVDLMPALDPDRLGLLPDLGEALMDVGDFAQAESVLRGAIASAAAIGDHRLRAEAGIGLLLLRLFGDDSVSGADAVREARRAITVFDLVGDQVGAAKAWRIIGTVHANALRYGDAAAAVERAIACARAGGDARLERRNTGAYAIAAVYGPTPVPAGIERCREIGAHAAGDRRTEGLVLCALAQLEAMRGEFAEARQLYTRGRAVLAEVGGGVLAASTALDSSAVELLAGDPAAAERDLRRDYALLDELGERYLLPTMAGVLAQALIAQDRHDEAAEICDRAEAAVLADDLESHVLIHVVRAELDLHAGRLADAAVADRRRHRHPARRGRAQHPGRTCRRQRAGRGGDGQLGRRLPRPGAGRCALPAEGQPRRRAAHGRAAHGARPGPRHRLIRCASGRSWSRARRARP